MLFLHFLHLFHFFFVFHSHLSVTGHSYQQRQSTVEYFRFLETTFSPGLRRSTNINTVWKKKLPCRSCTSWVVRGGTLLQGLLLILFPSLQSVLFAAINCVVWLIRKKNRSTLHQTIGSADRITAGDFLSNQGLNRSRVRKSMVDNS